MKILVNFATRSRPDKFLKRIKELNRMAARPHLVDILVKIDEDDETMKDMRPPAENVRFALGRSKNKIDAINRDITGDFDILVNMSDDMVCKKHGWDEVLREVYREKGLKLSAHFSDGTDVRDRLITMSIMGRKLYDFLGYVYHPSYISLWCDNEFMRVSQMLGCYEYFGGKDHKNVLFYHQHPAWAKDVKMDAQYQFTESFYKTDEANYIEREKINFGLTPKLTQKFKQL